VSLSRYVSLHTVKFRERVERLKRHVFHQNGAGLMENRDALLVIAGALLLVTLAIPRKT